MSGTYTVIRLVSAKFTVLLDCNFAPKDSPIYEDWISLSTYGYSEYNMLHALFTIPCTLYNIGGPLRWACAAQLLNRDIGMFPWDICAFCLAD